MALDQQLNADALAAALMMRAANRLSHSPGPGWPCYSPQGADGAGRSNLFLGRSGASAMLGYVDDDGTSTASRSPSRGRPAPSSPTRRHRASRAASASAARVVPARPGRGAQAVAPGRAEQGLAQEERAGPASRSASHAPEARGANLPNTRASVAISSSSS